MCGRFTYWFKWRELQRLMNLLRWDQVELSPRYNVAPTQPAPVVRMEGAQRVGVLARWGLVPPWAPDESIASRLFNARGETIAEKPAFRSAYAARRCLVPIHGFYEWKVLADAKSKQPYWIARKDREVFTLAGVWDRWEKGPSPIESFTIITTTPNSLMSALHDRMPVIIDSCNFDAWLDPVNRDLAGLSAIIRPHQSSDFEAIPVGKQVGNPRIDSPDLIDPIQDFDARGGLLF
jgi:putative SOS response-associated peptidase YedK